LRTEAVFERPTTSKLHTSDA